MGDKKKGDKLSYFVHCLPRFHELIGKSGAVGVTTGKMPDSFKRHESDFTG